MEKLQTEFKIKVTVVHDILTMISELKEIAWGLPDESYRFEATRVLKDIRQVIIESVEIKKEDE